MTDYADLEISLDPAGAGQYRVGLRLSLPGSDAPIELMGDEPALAQFDTDALGALADTPAEYGQALSRSLFAAEAARTFFEQARAVAASHSATLRVRLNIARTAPALHQLRWETLRDPKSRGDAFLFTDERTPFSRYLPSDDPRPVKTRPREDLKALVVIANPTNLDGWDLAEVKVADELKRARDGLGDIPLDALCRLDESAEPVPDVQILGLPTLNNLAEHLHSRYEILYLVCHGKLDKEVLEGGGTRQIPKVWLEDEHGAADVVPPYEHNVASGEQRAGLVDRIKRLTQLPRLIVLGSCQSAGEAEAWSSTDGGALAALGPLLAEAGVPAVIAMQGDVLMDTVAEFMPTFFEELLREETGGQIDLAMAAARAKVVGRRSDWWAPTLFMRLQSGRIAWHEPGFRVKDEPAFAKWPALIERIHDGNCTPILGPGLLDCLLGSSRELAKGWARQEALPLPPHQQEDLPTVAQYVGLKQDALFPKEQQLPKQLRRNILNHYSHLFQPDLEDAQKMPLDQLVDRVGDWLRSQDPAEPHRLLAGLPFPVYITANPDSLLVNALCDPGVNRTPEVALCPWTDELASAPPYEGEPTDSKPLVYYLFGTLDRPESMVLTQDDYFDYLIGMTQNRDQIPEVVKFALTARLILFLGFQLDDWTFRVLLRSIEGQWKTGLRKNLSHVAVQLDPGDEQALDPEQVRRYLKKNLPTVISVYWGRTEDFMRELRTQWNEMYGKERPL